jgi:hypothetical protein
MLPRGVRAIRSSFPRGSNRRSSRTALIIAVDSCRERREAREILARIQEYFEEIDRRFAARSNEATG